MQFLKENFDLILLLVGFLGVLISVISLMVEIGKKKRK